MTLMVPVAAARPSRSGRVAMVWLMAAAFGVVAAFSSLLVPSFVPPPLPTEVAAPGSEALQWLATSAPSKLDSLGNSLQECVEDGLDSAITAFEDLIGDEDDDLVGESWNPQLLPAGSLPMPKQKDALQQVIEPLTKLFMRYRRTIYPRCEECKIIVRFGRLWRTCRVRRHKTRQPGITQFKRTMNRFKGWRQIGPR
eukprot:TRINITY_DN411_c0_g2_i1.p1 TRINITY_DN411_c0_g2~~TRINITY_DN411_c0_g2_i1.p1  ORF type:complete len:197 (+),score=46.10 TRINITY_DN411_c0_g2_i1:52-642(+)